MSLGCFDRPRSFLGCKDEMLGMYSRREHSEKSIMTGTGFRGTEIRYWCIHEVERVVRYRFSLMCDTWQILETA